MEHTQAGFRAAIDRIRGVMREHGLRDIIVAIESTGTYHRPVQAAFRAGNFESRLVHPYASKQFRQPADPGNKTDDTDLAGIHRAAVNGFGLLHPVWPEDYLVLQQLARQRRDWVHKTNILRCQIKETLHQLMPGYAELFGAHFFESSVAVPLARATGSAAAVLNIGLEGLRAGLAEKTPQPHYRLSTLEKILAWARGAATSSAASAPSTGPLWRESLDRLVDDFLRKSQEISSLEQRSAHALVATPYILLLALPGINVVSAAELGGELGPISHYANAGRITGRAGLCPCRHQSDQVDRAGPLRRHGNRRLRAALLQIADNLVHHNHHYQLNAKRWQRLGKDPRWIRVKVAKSFSRLAFVLVTAQRLFHHAACQPRHSIFEKLLAFHTEHHTDMRLAMLDLDRAAGQVPSRVRREEAQLLQRLLDEPEARRRRGPVALAKILPVVLARLGLRTLQSEPEEQDLS
jgi:transposase